MLSVDFFASTWYSLTNLSVDAPTKIFNLVITVPSEYSTNSSDNVTLAGADIVKGLGSVVSGIVATALWVAKV